MFVEVHKQIRWKRPKIQVTTLVKSLRLTKTFGQQTLKLMALLLNSNWTVVQKSQLPEITHHGSEIKVLQILKDPEE